MAEKILIVDDDLDTVRLVGLMLERQGYQINAASSGQQALEIVRKDKPDLILLDLMMPEMDGISIARQLRASPETQDIFIVVFSAKNQIEDKLESFEAGADDYLTKPIQPRELVAHVKAVLKRSGMLKLPVIEEEAVHGKSIAVLSAKGGVGVSTVTVNLGITIGKLSQQKVLVADFRPGGGTIALELGLNHSEGLSRLLRLDSRKITRQVVENELQNHKFDIDFLLASASPTDAALLTSVDPENPVDRTNAIFNQLDSFAEYLLLDLGATYLPAVEAIAKRCDLRIIVLDGTPPSIVKTRLLLEQLSPVSDRTPSFITLIQDPSLNSVLSLDQVRTDLGRDISLVLGYAPELAFRAQTAHQPIVICDPAGEVTQQFYRLAAMVTNILR